MLIVNHQMETSGKAKINHRDFWDGAQRRKETIKPSIPASNDECCHNQEASILPCENYNMLGKRRLLSMPQSIFADEYGYAMQREISDYMKKIYEGGEKPDGLTDYFKECCISMKQYFVDAHRTSGNNPDDDAKIVSQVYEIFAKENQRAALQACYQDGKEMNEEHGFRRDDYVYYSSARYYQMDVAKEKLAFAAKNVADKWGISDIDAKKIESESKLTLDGGFDFNSGWNYIFQNQVGRCTLLDEMAVPPRDFSLFAKERTSPDAALMDEALRGVIKCRIGKETYAADIPYRIAVNSWEGQHFMASDLLANKSDFLGLFHVYSRRYAQAMIHTRI